MNICFAGRKKENHETKVADQNEARKASGEVLSQDFIKPHNEVGAVKETQMTFDDLRGIW